MPQDTSSSTTKPRGRPPGTRRQFKAERRLARELAAKNLQSQGLDAVTSVLTELVRAAKSNPVIGVGLGIVTVDLLYRTRVLSLVGAGAFYAFLGAKAYADIIGAIAGVLPFSHAAVERDSFQPTLQSDTNTKITYPKGTVAKEFL